MSKQKVRRAERNMSHTSMWWKILILYSLHKKNITLIFIVNNIFYAQHLNWVHWNVNILFCSEQNEKVAVSFLILNEKSKR